MPELKDVSTHFQFGQNWEDYSRLLDEARIDAALEGLRKLVGNDVVGQSLLDIGCGSGLHSLAALRLGASSVHSTDIDVKSVETTKATLRRFNPTGKWSAEVRSVFDMPPTTKYDVVYSWGVLHHTGNMMEAMAVAANLVKPGGRLVLALYRKTRLCSFWRLEKKFYTSASQPVRKVLIAIYAGLYLTAKTLTLENPVRILRDYREKRGMSFWHDINDWLGGYPYESISPEELHAFAVAHGLTVVTEISRKRRQIGFFGSGCDQYVLVRNY